MTKEMQYLKSNIELQALSLGCIDRFNNKGLKASIYDWGEQQ